MWRLDSELGDHRVLNPASSYLVIPSRPNSKGSFTNGPNCKYIKYFFPFIDFYEYACGGWIQNSVTTNTDRFTVVDKRNQNDIRKMLEMPEEPGGDSSAESKAKSFYRSCLNVSADHEKAQYTY